MERPVLYIVIPCYNEEEALPITAARMAELLDDLTQKGEIAQASRVTLVDDGSRDATWQVICELHARDPRFEGVKLAHNVGHMNALWAGLSTVCEFCDAVVTIDADLQDDVNAIYGFLQKYREGCDVVYGVRENRDSDSAFKRATAQGFYRLMGRLGVETVYNAADYRLLSRRAVEALMRFGEVNMFLRGMVPLLGFKSDKVFYTRGERVAGESKYPLRKMLALAVEGITSFSNKPIRLLTGVGVVCALMGVAMLVYVLASICAGHSAAGWASMMTSIWLLGGMQLIGLGLIGEYIGKIYMETKRRPKFILEQYLRDPE